MDGLTRFLDRAERGVLTIALVAGWICLPTVIAVRFFDVVAKQFFEVPSQLFQLIEWDGFFILVFLLFGFGYLRDAHARIDVLRGRFSPRRRAWIEVWGILLGVVPFASVMIVQGIEFTAISYDSLERWWVPGVDRWAKKTLLPVGFTLLLLSALLVLTRNLIYLATGRGDPAPAPHYGEDRP